MGELTDLINEREEKLKKLRESEEKFRNPKTMKVRKKSKGKSVSAVRRNRIVLGKRTTVKQRAEELMKFRAKNLARTQERLNRTSELRGTTTERRLKRFEDAQAKREFANQQREFRRQKLNSVRRMAFEPRGFGR